MPEDVWYRWDGKDLVLRLRVQTRAARDGFAGPQESRYRVRITAPPVDGKANAYLIGFLAKAFGVARSAVALEAGENGRDKRVRIRAPSRIPVEHLPPPGAR